MKENVTTLLTPAPAEIAAPLPVVPGYTVHQLLGRGGMGHVYAARQDRLERTVALKLVSVSHDETVLARFAEEVKAIASLRHPHIAQIYDSGQVEGRPYYAMELATGGTLSERLKTGPLPPRVAGELLVQLAIAMQHAHEQNILHRDLKPANILLSTAVSAQTKLNPKITDFGLAKRLSSDAKLTQTGDIFGSPSYMAPEQASGVMKLSTTVDVYALGAVLYECLTGRPPFLGPDPMQTLMLTLSTDPVPPRQLQPNLPADLETICMKCLEKQPKKRYSTAQELADDVQRYLDDVPILARPVGTLERVQKWAMRRPWQATAVALGIALFVGLFVGMLFLQNAYRATRIKGIEADQAFSLSRNRLTDMLSNFTTELDKLPNTEKITLDSIRPAVELFRELHALRPNDQQTALEYFEQLQSYSTRLALSHRFDEAKTVFLESEKLIEAESTKQPENFEWQLNLIKHYINRGWVLRRQSKRDEAVTLERLAMTALASLKPQHGNDVRLLTQSNELLKESIADLVGHSLQATNVEEKKRLINQIVDQHREVMLNCDRRYQLEPSHQHASLLLNAQKSLAGMLLATNQTDEAELLYRNIAEKLPSLQLDEQSRLSFQVQVDADRGDLARRRRDFTSAAALFQQARQSNQQLRERYPEDTGFLFDWFSLRYKVSLFLHDEGKVAESMKELKACLRDLDAAIAKFPQYGAFENFRKNVAVVLEHYEDQAPRNPGK